MRGDEYPGLSEQGMYILLLASGWRWGGQPIFKLALDWSFNFPQSFSVIISSLKTIRLRSKKEFRSKKETLGMSIFPGGMILTGMCWYAFAPPSKVDPHPAILAWRVGWNFFEVSTELVVLKYNNTNWSLPQIWEFCRGLYHAPVIPAGIWSFLWNPAESGRIIFGRESCQNCHSGDHLFQRNRAILVPIPEWSWNGPEWNLAECWLHLW